MLALREQWYERLKDEGFVDIEDRRGNLKQYDRRTQAFENRDILYEFFVKLEHFITDHPELPLQHKRILSLYADGTHVNDIAALVGRHRCNVFKIIRTYRKTVWGGHRQHFPL